MVSLKPQTKLGRILLIGVVGAGVICSTRISIVYSEQTTSLLEPTADAYRRLGYEAQKKGQWDQALRYYEKAVALGYRNPTIYNDLGVLYEQLGQPKQALWYYEEALKLDPNYLPAYTNLAYFYKDRGDTVTALKYFKKRLALSSTNDPWADKIRSEIAALLDPDGRRQKVAVADALGRLEEQRNRQIRMNRIHEFAEQVAQARQLYAQGMRLLEEKKYDEALQIFDAAARLNPGDPVLLEARRRAEEERKIEWIRREAQDAVFKLKTGEADEAQKKFQNILTTLKDGKSDTD